MKVALRELEFDVRLPALDLREELVYAYGEKYKRQGVALMRVYAAMIGLCLPEVAFGLKIDARGARSDLAEYGGNVYVALREKGWTTTDMGTAGQALLRELMRETFPRQAEVVEARKNSEGGAAS